MSSHNEETGTLLPLTVNSSEGRSNYKKIMLGMVASFAVLAVVFISSDTTQILDSNSNAISPTQLSFASDSLDWFNGFTNSVSGLLETKTILQENATAPEEEPIIDEGEEEPVAGNNTAPADPVVIEGGEEPVAGNATSPTDPVVVEGGEEPVGNTTAPADPVVEGGEEPVTNNTTAPADPIVEGGEGEEPVAGNTTAPADPVVEGGEGEEPAAGNTTAPADPVVEEGEGEEPVAGNNTAPVSPISDDGEAQEEAETDGMPDEAAQELIGDSASMCNQNDVPIAYIQEGLTVPAGCVAMVNRDITTIPIDPRYKFASVVTACTTAAGGDFMMDSAKLGEYDLVYGDISIISALGSGDSAMLTLYDQDAGEGVYKNFIGAANPDGAYTHLESTLANKYMENGEDMGMHVFSAKATSKTDTLSDCRGTVDVSEVKKFMEAKKMFLEREHEDSKAYAAHLTMKFAKLDAISKKSSKFDAKSSSSAKKSSSKHSAEKSEKKVKKSEMKVNYVSQMLDEKKSSKKHSHKSEKSEKSEKKEKYDKSKSHKKHKK